ncbi:MAG: ATP-dependent helicase [Anaerolineae bacterium]|nr:ATP-dependent helicase [Anaerolineae bacterium]
MFTRQQFDTFLAGLKYPPNPFQLRVLESLAFGDGNIVVSALAGSGKTSLLVMTAQLFKQMGVPSGSAGYLAFNVTIKEELNRRLEGTGYSATNSHSMGLACLKQVKPAAKVDTAKFRNLCREIVDEANLHPDIAFVSRRHLEALTSKVMLNNVDLSSPDVYEDFARLAEQYGIDCDPQIFPLVRPALAKAREIFEKTGAVSFDEMLFLPVVMNLQPKQHDYFLVDECQDLSVLQQILAFRSIRPGGRLVFVGDRNQAIYGFAGADYASFGNIITATNAEVMPLNVCYRCPTSVIDLARRIVPAIEARPNAPAGKVEHIKETDVVRLAQNGDLLLCRLSAPLVSAYFDFIRQQRRAFVLGKDIGRQLITLLDKVAAYDGFSYPMLSKYLAQYLSNQTQMLAQREGTEQQIETLNDQIETLNVCFLNFTGVKTMDGFKDALNDLFSDDAKDSKSIRKDAVNLCTVHKAKGLETERVFILKPNKMPLVWQGQKPDQYEQEINILYVAVTRATETLYIVGDLPVPLLAPLSQVVQAELAADPESAASIDTPTTVLAPVTDSPIGESAAAQQSDKLRDLLRSLNAAEIDHLIALLQAIREEKTAA